MDKEKIKERIRLSNQRLFERANNLVKSLAEEEEVTVSTQSLSQNRKVGGRFKIMDLYKMEQHYNFRSSSFVDKREQAVQTMPDMQNSKQRKTSVIGKGILLKNPNSVRASLLGVTSLNPERESAKKLRIGSLNGTQENNATDQIQEKQLNIIELDNEKKHSILTSQTFGEYFSEASKFVEKIIGRDENDELEDGKTTKAKTAPQIESQFTIEMPISFKNGTVNSLAWSPLIQDVFLTIYSEPVDAAVYDKLLIWNVNFKHRPEFELYSSSKIQQAIFSPFSTEIIVAGLENGRVCIYDLRAKKEPVLKSGISQDSHKTPITGLQFIGTNNSSNLVSISEEGRLCIWQPSKLDAPRKVELIYNEKKEDVENYQFPNEPVCIGSIPGDISSAFVGCTDNRIYQCITDTSQLDQAPKYFTQVFAGHSAVVSCLHMNQPNSKTTELSGLMLSGSLDWTVKLWNPKNARLLSTIEFQKDAVSDVNWNYAEPCLFSAASVGGTVAVYNLIRDFDNPVISFDMNECVLNSKWDSSGRLLAITDSHGKVHIKKFNNSAFEYTQSEVDNLQNILKYENR